MNQKETIMRKLFFFLLTISILLTLVACEGVSKKEVEDLEKKISELTEMKGKQEDTINTLKQEKTTLNDQLNKLKSEFESYKEKMKPYEGLSEAEAEAKRIEAEKIAEEKAKEEAAKKAAEEKAAAEREAKGYETGLTYQDLARNPDTHKGSKIKFSGKVVQLIEGDKQNELRFAIDEDYDQMIYLAYDKTIVSQRVLEDDILTIYGVSIGTITYNSTGGGPITIPAATVDRIDFN